MGEASRRQKLDPNYGQPNREKSKLFENVKKHIHQLLLTQAKIDDNTAIFSLFTNDDRGCNPQEIKILQKQIPLLYPDENFTIWVLPQKYASKPVEQAINYFIPIEVGTTRLC